MSAETVVYSTLTGAAAVAAIIGAPPNAKIWPDEAEDENAKPPLIVFERTSSEPEYTLNNTLAATRVLMHVTCWHVTRLGAETLGDAVQAALLAAGYPHTARESAFDDETDAYAAVLAVEIWE